MNKYSHPLAATSVRVLEDWAMMMVEPGEVMPGECGGRVLVATVQFKGVVDGKVQIVASDEFARTLAANVLGISSDDESIGEYSVDSLKELGNILTGNFLTEDYGADNVFTLSMPSVCQKLAPEHLTSRDERIDFIFDADSCRIAITFSGVNGSAD